MTSDSLSLVCWCVFLFSQEASTQESWWEGNGPGGELPAKIPAGEGPLPESRVPDLLPAARTGTWPAGAEKERLLKFQENSMEWGSCRVIIRLTVDNLLSIRCSHYTLGVQFHIKVSFLILQNEAHQVQHVCINASVSRAVLFVKKMWIHKFMPYELFAVSCIWRVLPSTIRGLCWEIWA